MDEDILKSMHDLYEEARRTLKHGDAEDVANLLARDLTPAQAGTISAAFYAVERDA